METICALRSPLLKAGPRAQKNLQKQFHASGSPLSYEHEMVPHGHRATYVLPAPIDPDAHAHSGRKSGAIHADYGLALCVGWYCDTIICGTAVRVSDRISNYEYISFINNPFYHNTPAYPAPLDVLGNNAAATAAIVSKKRFMYFFAVRRHFTHHRTGRPILSSFGSCRRRAAMTDYKAHHF